MRVPNVRIHTTVPETIFSTLYVDQSADDDACYKGATVTAGEGVTEKGACCQTGRALAFHCTFSGGTR